MRDPMGPEVHFGSEQFIDELAAAAGEDPVAFRLKYMSAPRNAAVVKAAAEKAGCKPHTAPRGKRTGKVLRAEASPTRSETNAPFTPERVKAALAAASRTTDTAGRRA